MVCYKFRGRSSGRLHLGSHSELGLCHLNQHNPKHNHTPQNHTLHHTTQPHSEDYVTWIAKPPTSSTLILFSQHHTHFLLSLGPEHLDRCWIQGTAAIIVTSNINMMKYSQPCEYEDTPSQQIDDIAAYLQWIYFLFSCLLVLMASEADVVKILRKKKHISEYSAVRSPVNSRKIFSYTV